MSDITFNRDVLISVIVPVYKESGNIRPFLSRIIPVLERIGAYEIIFCLDPSPDDTKEVILAEAEHNPSIALIQFSRRFGQPAATLAGVRNCRGDYCVVIDVDLQDPPELIVDLYNKIQTGYDVVYAQRQSREGETLVKKFISWLGYRVINRFSDVTIPKNTGDFRIINRKVINHLLLLNESHGFLRGMVALVGFKQGSMQYKRASRHDGAGNYNRLLGSLRIGLNGLIGFSSVPLSLLMYLGIFILIGSFLGTVYIFSERFIFHQNFPLGVPTILCLLLFLMGITMFSLGLLGEYVGRIYDEVKGRPLYIIESAVNLEVTDQYGRIK